MPLDDGLEPDRTCFDTRFVGPKGAKDNVRLMLVGEAPGEAEAEAGMPFVGKAGQRLHQMLEAAGIAEERCRFFNAVPYRPIGFTAEGRSANRTPTPEEINKYSVYLLKDIEKVNPDVIVCLGASALQAFGIVEKVGVARSKRFRWRGKPVFCTYHPSYIERTGGMSGSEYKSVLADLKRFWAYEDQPEEDIAGKELRIIDGFLLDELRKLEALFPETKLSLDYEASGLNTYSVDFKIAGISIASLDGKRTSYIHFYSLDRYPTENQIPSECLDYLKVWLESKRFVVYNMQYECAATISFFGIELREVEDVLMYCRCLNDAGTLKDVASRRLGVPKWNLDVEIWNDAYVQVRRALKRMRKRADGILTLGDIIFQFNFLLLDGVVKKILAEYSNLILAQDTVDCREAANFFRSEPETLAYIQGNPGAADPLKLFTLGNSPDNFLFDRHLDIGLNVYERSLYTGVHIIVDLLKKYYPIDAIEIISTKVISAMKIGLENYQGALSFTDIPLRIIAPYALEDSASTGRLYTNVREEIDNDKLTIPAEFYNDQARLGYELELNGIAWNDIKAEELQVIYTDTALDSLRRLLLYPAFQEKLSLTPSDIIKIQTSISIKELCVFFNPASTLAKTRNAFSALVLSNRVRFALMLYEIHSKVLGSVHPDEDVAKDLPVLYPIYKSVMGLDSKDKLNFIINMVENGEIIKKNILTKKREKKHENEKAPPIELDLFLKYSDYKFESLKSEVIERLFEMATDKKDKEDPSKIERAGILGMDIDDKTTWIEEFWQIYYFRLHKKVMKSKTSYIEGKSGRGSVFSVKKNAVYGRIAARNANYYDCKAAEDEIYLVNTQFGVNTAITRRWRSWVHTIPWDSDLMDLRVSRFPDGCRLHFDQSQSELKVLARLSGDKNLHAAFLAGKDIHRFVASRVYKIPEEKVSDPQRRNAKSSSFGIVFGKTVENFAAESMKGDVPAAKKFFADFFGEFPGVLTFIQDKHWEAITTGYITTIFGDRISVDMPEFAVSLPDDIKKIMCYQEDGLRSKEFKLDDDYRRDSLMRSAIAKAMRNAQNYPIQSTSSSIVAVSIYRISRIIQADNLTSKIDCFTHDSGDIDTQLKDVPKLLETLPKEAEIWPRETFQIPMVIDCEIGVSGNHMIGLHSPKFEGKIVNTNFTCRPKALEMFSDKAKQWNIEVDYKIEKEKNDTVSLGELFAQKRAFSTDIGKPFKKISGTLTLDFSKVTSSDG